MKIVSQYKGLRRENYILFIGRMVTNLGAMVWPVLTLILNKKMGMNATQVSIISIIAGLVLVPAGLLGGKLADKFDKKKVIIYSDAVSIVFFIACGLVPLSGVSIVLITVAAALQSMENPAYNALIADITYTKDRERAYSLQYLGSNIGLVASPVIAGLLFKNYLWLSFIISGVAIGMSTVLIYFFVQNTEPVQEKTEGASYQKNKHGESLFSVLKHSKVLVLYILVMGLYQAAYLQYGCLMPLDLGRVHGDDGAVIYGSVSSLNCVVVVLFTPIFTRIFRKIAHTKMNLMGQSFLLIGYVIFLLYLGNIPFYYAAIVLFTFGEILTTLANGPYLTLRAPASHRGRINGLLTVVQSVMQGGCMLLSGILYDAFGSTTAWTLVFSILAVGIVLSIGLIFFDKRRYKELY